MVENQEYALRGGTFFVLLLQARKQRTSIRRNDAGKNDGLTDSEILKGLLEFLFLTI